MNKNMDLEKVYAHGLDIISEDYSERFICKCGNTVTDDGFSTWEEHEANKVDLPWDAWDFSIDGCPVYRCIDCGRFSIVKAAEDMPVVDGKKVACFGVDDGRCYYKFSEDGDPVYTDSLLAEIHIDGVNGLN